MATLARSLILFAALTTTQIQAANLPQPAANQLHQMITRHSQDMASIMEDTKTILQQHDVILEALSNQQPGPSTHSTTPRTPLSIPQSSPYPSNCVDVKALGNSPSGLYTVYMPSNAGYGSPQPITVYCDMTTEDGAWITFLQRKGKGEYFPTRTWEEYKHFFGNPLGSFWLGLETLHKLTSQGHWKLRVELEDWEGEKRYAAYSYFRIGSEADGYRLYVSGYSGNAGDGLSSHHNGRKFSTIDRDNDEHLSISCSERYNQAWWYNRCVAAALTGEYYEGVHTNDHQGVYWRYWKGEKYSYKRAVMKIMPTV